MKVSIVIPVYNAERTIEILCNSLITLYSQKYQLQIVLVNDGSTDGSDGACRRLYSDHPSIITYVRLSRNFGEHNALMAGLHNVTGDFCVMMDDDLQNPPEEVGRLVDEIVKGYDVVYTYNDSRKYGLFRNLGSRFNDKVATIILKKPSDLYLSSFKAINRFLVEEITRHDGPDPYIDGIIIRTTTNIGRIDVMHRERSYSRSGYTLKKLISLWGNMVVSFSIFPLRLAGVAGVLFIIYSVSYGFYKAYDDIHTSGRLSEFETLMSANMLFRGLSLLAVSILGEYVGRIYMAINKDPQFVIRERLSSRKGTAKLDLIATLRERDGRRER